MIFCAAIGQTGAGKKTKNVVQVRQIESAREIVPQKYAGDATYETQIDTEKDRYACYYIPLSLCSSSYCLDTNIHGPLFINIILTCRDARAIMERNIKLNEDGSAEQESGKVYKGQAGYKNYISKNESQIGMNKYTGYVKKI